MGVQVDVTGAGTASLIVVVVHAEVGRGGARYRELQLDSGDQLLVRHVRVTVVADQLIESAELDVLQVERGRRGLRALDVEVLDAARMSTQQRQHTASIADSSSRPFRQRLNEKRSFHQLTVCQQ